MPICVWVYLWAFYPVSFIYISVFVPVPCCLFFFFNLFMAVLGLRFCARAFSCCGKWGPLFIAVRGPLTITASLVAEHRLQTHRLSNCGSWAQLLRGMWDPPRPGLEPVSPALAGRLSTTAPPGKPHAVLITVALWYSLKSGSLIPPALFLFLRIALAIRGLLCFHMNCKLFLF